MCCCLGRCHFRHSSYTVCALYMCVCVLIAVILGEAENDEENLFESSRARFCYDSAWSYRHLVCLKGKRKVDLLFLFALLLPSLPFLFDLSHSFSLTFTHSFSVSVLLELGENSCCTACAQASHLTGPAYPINHGTLLTAVCMDASALEREKLRTLRVNDFETIYPEGLRPLKQQIMFHKLQQYITDPPNPLWSRHRLTHSLNLWARSLISLTGPSFIYYNFLLF